MKKYPKYKPSGVDWIGEIPEHWEVSNLKQLTMIISGYAFKTEDYSDTEGISIIRIGDISDKIDLTFVKKVIPSNLNDLERFVIKNEDLLVAMTGATIGKSCTYSLREKVYANQRVCIIRNNEKLNQHYIKSIIDSFYFKEFIKFKCSGSAQENISTSEIGGLKVVFPKTNEEQTQIAAYLDYKTNQIETLIANKQKLIELLQEERTAVINQAVTKGINPKAKLKPTGIEWLGEVPENWEVKKLKYLTKIRYGLGQPPKQKVGGLPILRATNVYRGIIDTKDLLFVDPDDLPWTRNPLLKENDIIVVRSGAYTADSALITSEFDGAVTGYDMVITPTDVNPQLLAYSLLSTYMLDNQLFLLRLRAAQPHLNSEDLGSTFMLVPRTNEEQSQIVDYIKNEHGRIDIIITKTKQEIELLKEYKTALISEVVTGKVDVRDAVVG